MAVALIVAGAVAVSGAVSWVGLVIPHLARMWVGPDHRVLLPVSFLLGGAYIVLVDTIARTADRRGDPAGRAHRPDRRARLLRAAAPEPGQDLGKCLSWTAWASATPGRTGFSGTSASGCAPARPPPCWAPTAAARPPWCAAPPGCWRRRRERSAGRTGAGYVPQAHGSAFAYRALDMVLMGRARQVGVFRTPGPADRAAALEAMERVGVAGLQDRLFPTLSGGEQQLVLIARAIAAGCPVLVLDEPATGLDLKNQVRVLTLLRELMADGMALLLSTHHPDHALYLADRVVLLGRSGARTGPAAELLTDAALSALYGVPVEHARLFRRRRGPPHHRRPVRLARTNSLTRPDVTHIPPHHGPTLPHISPPTTNAPSPPAPIPKRSLTSRPETQTLSHRVRERLGKYRRK